MLNAADAAELRSLQVKAYGRDGGLSEAEARRLSELETARVEPAVEPVDRTPAVDAHGDVEASGVAASGVEASGVEASDGAQLRPAVDGSPVADDAASEHEPADPRRGEPVASGLRGALRQHVRAVAAASALLLVVGLVAGWALFGRPSGGIDLTGPEQERRSELQAGDDFDAGSVRAIGKDDDALVWFGTKQDGVMNCIVLDVGEQSSTACQRADDETNPWGFGAQLQTGEGKDSEQVSASAVRSATGEVVAVIQRWESDPDSWLSQFAGEDRTRADELMAAGYDGYSFSIVGEFGGAPVWQAMRTEDGVSKQCLIVDAVGAATCLEPEKVQGADGIEVSGASVDGETGEVLGEWSVKLAYTSSGMSYLVISGDDPEALQAPASGDSIELGSEHGDPILVTIPGD